MPTNVGTRDSYIEPSFPSTQRDPLRNFPLGHRRALIDYYKTKDVLLKGNAREVPARTHNDVNFALQRDIARGQGPISSVRKRPFDLVTADFVNERDTSAPVAISGLYTTSVNDAGTFVPVGTHAENTASPSILSYTTVAAQASGLFVVGLFVIEPLDADGVVGVLLRGTAATDHLRTEYRTTDTSVHLVTRAASADTSNANATPPSSVLGNSGTDMEYYVAIGLRLNADNTYVVAVNGTVQLSGTISAGAQALTGNAVGIRQSGVAPGTGVILFQAHDLKVAA